LFNPFNSFNPLRASDINSRHDDIATYDGCSTELLYCTELLKTLNLIERGENLLHNGILHFVFTLSQSSEIVLQSLKDWNSMIHMHI